MTRLPQLDLRDGMRIDEERPSLVIAETLAQGFGYAPAMMVAVVVLVESKTGRRWWQRRWGVLDADGALVAYVSYVAEGVPDVRVPTADEQGATRLDDTAPPRP